MEISRFSNRLRSFRRQHGYSRKKVARLLGHADTSTLSRWERGITLPRLVHAFQLSTLYQTAPHELFDGLWNAQNSDEGLLLATERITSNED